MTDSVFIRPANPSEVAVPATSRQLVGAPPAVMAGVAACGIASLLLLLAAGANWFQTDDLLTSFTTPPQLRALAAMLGLFAGALAGLMLIRTARTAVAVVAIIAGVISFGIVALMVIYAVKGFTANTGFGPEVVHLQPQIGVVLAGLGAAALAIGGVSGLVASASHRPPTPHASWVRPSTDGEGS